MFNKILIANRGEIAVRVIKACKEMGITSVAIYSDVDKNSLHARISDVSYYIGSSNVVDSYLNIDKIINLALKVGIDAIHPGYGFLSENPIFIKKVNEAGIKFIGPSSTSVELMGNKTAARMLMMKAGIPIVPGSIEPIKSKEEALRIAEEIGYPVMLKAAAGGGGKGMRKAFNEKELSDSIQRAQNEALKSFGNSNIYLEKLILNPKHIEVQILADEHGNYIHLFERECSIQRRHQKVIEEAPSSSINPILRNKITNIAIKAAKACNYYNAGTIEFLYDKRENFYFLEMNTRLQVEHPVTELITGIDIVKEQIKIANNDTLQILQENIKINGHAIECRIYAEDIENNFAPSIGIITEHSIPSGPGCRVDSGIDIKTEVSVFYDPILSKVIAWGKNREEAISRMQRLLSEYKISGVRTNINGFNWLLAQKQFLDSSFDINFIEDNFIPLLPNKWKKSIEQDDLFAILTLAAHLKDKEDSLKPAHISNNNLNKWIKSNDE